MRASLIAVVLLAACGGDDEPAKTVYFDLDEPLEGVAGFWNFPFPSDLRTHSTTTPDLTGFPNPRNVPILNALISVVGERRGWPTMPAAYVRFTAPVPDRVITDVIPADSDEVMLVDIDATSPERGTTFPLVAQTLPVDPYVPSGLVAFAPRPGIVLQSNTRYAYVVRSAFAPGFEAPSTFKTLAAGKQPSGERWASASSMYGSLWSTLETKGIPKDDVLVATVFTTGDEIQRAAYRSDALRAAHHPTIDGLALEGGNTYDGFCVLRGTITMPQFPRGAQPYDTDGRFELDGDDIPIKQGEMTIPVTITLPKGTMPANGWPLYQFFHGSGGVSTGLVDLGYSPTPDGEPELGKGPGYVVARHGIAAASTAMPVNPERLPGATDYAYLNINNLSAFPFVFQQGVFEQRLLLDALLALQIPAATVAGCGAAVTHRFDPQKLMAGGQSMGGMYTNMVGAVEPRFGALVPTAAGGFWNLMILDTSIIPGARGLLSAALGVDDTQVVFAHPALNTMALGWEIAEPMAYMARIGRRPLVGASARHVYEPVAAADEYFPIGIYDAAALAYGNEQAGATVWPSMQDALAVDGLDGLIPYPVKGNRDGKTRVVVQFSGDGIVNSHFIYRQLEAVKHQYGCFLASYVRDGVPTVPAPGMLTDLCP